MPKEKSWEKMYRTELIPLTPGQIEAHVRHAREVDGVEVSAEDVERLTSGDEVWTNRRYQCLVAYLTPAGALGWLHLSIKRRSKAVIRDWRDLQRIKNDVAGPQREAFEIFPAESRLVDTANQYHLWALPVGEKVDLGFDTRRVTDKVGITGARQRPFT